MKLVDFLCKMADQEAYEDVISDQQVASCGLALVELGKIVQTYIGKYDMIDVSDFAETYFQNDSILIDGTDNVLPDIMQLMLQEIK